MNGKRSERRENTRKWLKCYHALFTEIASRERHLQEYTAELYNTIKGSSNEHIGHSNSVSDPTYKAVQTILDKHKDNMQEMQSRIDILNGELEKIECVVKKLSGYERVIIFNRFIGGLEWAEIAVAVGYSPAQCARLECSALDKIEKMIDHER